MQPDRPVQSTLAFHASRIVTDVGVLLAMASMSMTFVIAPEGDRSALDADALPALLLLLPVFAVTLIPDHARPLHPALGWLSLVLALAALPYSFVKMLDAGVLADTLGGSVGLGSRVLVVGCLVTLLGVGIGLFRELMGWPSGGTPRRNTTYETKKPARQPVAPSGKPLKSEAADPATAPEPGEAPTRLLTAVSPGQPEQSEEPGAEAEKPDGSPSKPQVPGGAAQPEIVFPDTGAVAREAEPEEPDDDGLLNTAERADAALTDHLATMFADEDDDNGADDGDDNGPTHEH